MNVSAMLVTEPDLLTISGLLEAGRRWPAVDRTGFRAFGRRLGAAGVLRDHEMPRDVVTLLSRVRVKDLETQEDASYTLVIRVHASEAAGAISVLSPMGAALLGLRGRRRRVQSCWCGLRRLRIEAVSITEAAAREPLWAIRGPPLRLARLSPSTSASVRVRDLDLPLHALQRSPSDAERFGGAPRFPRALDARQVKPALLIERGFPRSSRPAAARAAPW